MSIDIPHSHPGKYLAEYLDEYGISQYHLAKFIHVSPHRINEIVHGQCGITADTALRLGRYFSTSAQFWMNLQAGYDLGVIRSRCTRISSHVGSETWHRRS